MSSPFAFLSNPLPPPGCSPYTSNLSQGFSERTTLSSPAKTFQVSRSQGLICKKYLEMQLSKLAEEQAKLQKQKDQAVQERAKAEGAIALKEQSLLELEKEVQTKSSIIKDLQTMIAQQAKVLETLEKERKEAAARLTNATELLANEHSNVDDVSQATQLITVVSMTIKTKIAEKQRINEANKQTQAQIDKLKAECLDRRTKKTQLEGEIQNLQKSQELGIKITSQWKDLSEKIDALKQGILVFQSADASPFAAQADQKRGFEASSGSSDQQEFEPLQRPKASKRRLAEDSDEDSVPLMSLIKKTKTSPSSSPSAKSSSSASPSGFGLSENVAAEEENPMDILPKEPSDEALSSSPLHAKIMEDKLTAAELIAFLTTCDAALINKKVEGWTPLHHLIFHGEFDLIKAFLEHPKVSKDPRIKKQVLMEKTGDGLSCLQLLACYDSMNQPGVDKFIKQFREAGVLINGPIERPPGHIAAYYGHGEVLAALASPVERCASLDFSALDRSGLGIVHYMALSNNQHMVKEMIKVYNVNVNLKTKEGFTALMYASDLCYLGMVNILLRHPKTDPTLADNSGNTAYTHACLPTVGEKDDKNRNKVINLISGFGAYDADALDTSKPAKPKSKQLKLQKKK